MDLQATVDSTYDDGSPRGLRDQDGGLWRVTLDDLHCWAVEEVAEWGAGPTMPDLDCLPVLRCGLATPQLDGTWEITPVAEGRTFGVNAEDEYTATADGWRATED